MKPLSAEEIAKLRGMLANLTIPIERVPRLAEYAARLLDEVERTRALLRRIEWYGGGSGEDRCPECGGAGQHSSGCELAALLGGEPTAWRSRLQAIITELDREHTPEALALANRLNDALLGGEC